MNEEVYNTTSMPLAAPSECYAISKSRPTMQQKLSKRCIGIIIHDFVSLTTSELRQTFPLPLWRKTWRSGVLLFLLSFPFLSASYFSASAHVLASGVKEKRCSCGFPSGFDHYLFLTVALIGTSCSSAPVAPLICLGLSSIFWISISRSWSSSAVLVTCRPG